MLALIATAKTFGVRPSSLLGMEDSVLSLAFDLAAAARVIEESGDKQGVNRVYL